MRRSGLWKKKIRCGGAGRSMTTWCGPFGLRLAGLFRRRSSEEQPRSECPHCPIAKREASRRGSRRGAR